MTKLLVLGSSQAASLYFAKDVFAAHKSTSTDWFVAPALFSYEINPVTGKVDVPAA
jgi:hypothetical protein